MIITLSNISVQQLKRAVIIREQIEQLEGELAGIFGESRPQPATTVTATNGHRGRRKMSASARAKIAAAQRLRWAKQRKGAKASPKSSMEAPKRRRKMSPAARAAISAAATARWAKAKAANRRTLAG